MIIGKKNLAVLHACDTKNGRLYTEYAYINEGVIAGTDGSCLFISRLPDQKKEAGYPRHPTLDDIAVSQPKECMMIPAVDLARAMKDAPTKSPIGVLNNSLRVLVSDTTIHLATTDLRTWRVTDILMESGKDYPIKAIQTMDDHISPEAATVHLQVDMLKKLVAVAEAHGETILKIEVSGSDKPVRVTSGDLTGYLMPIQERE